ncbi:hypothetical protein EV426DRAFT_361971 [Tirmania nivea]|nr:hypothetical protein EV426DRAFT_361971 [Tirmania nivea]
MLMAAVEHDEEYFAAVDDLSDSELVDFDVGSLEEVKVDTSAYGVFILGKVHLQKVEDGYIYVRMYVGKESGEKIQQLHRVLLG